MCPREDIECQCSKMQESKLAKLQETLDAVLMKLGEKKNEE